MSESEEATSTPRVLLETRGYQQEMLDESLRTNLIIALDTGSGKTHIAILRMKLEAEREAKKVSWFVAPTVALCEQQRDVIEKALPLSVGLISGSLEPDQWKDPVLWRRVLETHRVMVTTPQVLLDALRHGYINLGRDIGLIVFDEAHHAVDNHPYNRIMKEFYFVLPRRPVGEGTVFTNGSDAPAVVRPMILGLTASPIYGGHVEQAFRIIEANLDSAIRAPRRYREELASFVHRPVFKHAIYHNDPYTPSANIIALESVLNTLDIEDDPDIVSLRAQLKRLPPGPDRTRVDQKLSKRLQKQDTYTHKGLRDLHRTAVDICADLGPWAADWYIESVLEQAKNASNPYNNVFNAWQNKEKMYLLNTLAKIAVTPTSSQPEDIVAGTSHKLQKLIECLENEKTQKESYNEDYSGLVFVTRRDAVIALAEVLTRHPRTRDAFQVGCLIGSSDSTMRHSFLDIARNLCQQQSSETLREFRIKEKNLIVSTSVAEEGIDIQACGNVIRWDPPPNMASWAQSRGRARRERSSFVLMFGDDGVYQKQVLQWEQLEDQMTALYNDPTRKIIIQSDEEPEADDDEERSYVVESTGATVTLHSAIGHLAHFCSILPGASYGQHNPIYDVDPPDLPEGWHLSDPRHDLPPYQGPFGATVTLPRLVDAELRVHMTERKYPSKISAKRHAAFFAYIALYEAGLLNEHLLPLTSAVDPQDEDVQELLKDVERRAGTASVTEQLRPWVPLVEGLQVWYRTELAIQGLPPLFMLTRVRVPQLSTEDLPRLYTAECGEITVEIRNLDQLDETHGDIQKAREYTRQMLWPLYGHRMNWDRLDLECIFLPADFTYDKVWADRRSWATQLNAQAGHTRPQDTLAVNAQKLGKHYSYPKDLNIVRDGGWPGKPYQFVRWQSTNFSPEEKDEFEEKYGESVHDVSGPLLSVRRMPHRVNFLVPRDPAKADPSEERTMLFDPQYVLVDLMSSVDVQYAKFIPALLRSLSVQMTVTSLRDDLFSSCPMSTTPLRLLNTAITAPVSQEITNYQRMETLGDTVLKFLTSIQLLASHPLWHEGYLAKRKDHAVSNVNLAKEAVRKSLYRWIIRDRFVPRRWKPNYEIAYTQPDSSGEREMTEDKKQQLSTKVLADVVESLIGAAYLHGNFQLAMECIQFFGLGMSWEHLPVHVDKVFSRTEELPEIPSEINKVEQILGYTFVKKHFLVEALTHPSYHTDLGCRSYDRMEFLGDAVLDMVVTDFLYHAPGKEYKPGHIHMRKTAVVNSHFLAFICLRSSLSVQAKMPRPDSSGAIIMSDDDQRIYLWQCILHSSMRVLEDMDITFGRYKKNEAEIEEALKSGTVYPWAALTRLQAAKFFSDVVESLLGAVYLDCHGDFEVVRKVLEKLGVLPILQRIVDAEVDVVHPVSRLANWAAKRQMEVEYVFSKENACVSCVVKVDWIEQVKVTEHHRGRASQDEVKFTAAEQALKVLQVKEEEEQLLDEQDEEVNDNEEWGAEADAFPL